MPEGATETPFGVNTSLAGRCKYDENDIPYASMTKNLDDAPAMQHMITLSGIPPGTSDRFVACVSADNSQSITGYKITIQAPGPQQGNGVEFTNSIRDIIDGSVPAAGTITIDGKEGPGIVNGNYKVTKDMNLAIGSRPYLVITAPPYYTRELNAIVTPRGFEADLGGGRTEFPLTLYRDGPTFNTAEYAALCLRDGGILRRITEPLKFAVFDKKIYRWQNGGQSAVEESDFDMRALTKSELIKALRVDLPSTNNGIYTSSNIDSYIHLQSRGDALPDLSKGNLQDGWLIITQNSEKTGWLINRGDNGYQTKGRITAGFMSIRTNLDVYDTQWLADTLQTLGTNELPANSLYSDKLAPYIKTMFSRPVGHRLPDNSR